jgi:hypothetical protein
MNIHEFIDDDPFARDMVVRYHFEKVLVALDLSDVLVDHRPLLFSFQPVRFEWAHK